MSLASMGEEDYKDIPNKGSAWSYANRLNRSGKEAAPPSIKGY